MDNYIIEFKFISTSDQGTLAFFESERDIPFKIKRIYYIYYVPKDEKRGMHAHKELQQVLWCPYGEIEVELDNGKEKRSYLLNSPQKALLVLKGFWREIYWRKEGSVLCVAASHYYNEDDYIRDYDEFLKYAKEGY